MDDPAPVCTSDSVFTLCRGVRLQLEVAQNGWVLLYPEGMVQLSETAAAILRRLDGVASVGQLIHALNQLYSADTGADVIEFLETACEHRWIQRREP